MKRIGIVLAPTTFFMALYFVISTLLMEQRRANNNEEEEAEPTEMVRAQPEDEELKNKQPKTQPDSQLD
jgi:flagellar biosynthesis/type III secretory pathway M-ring protein FliF/YscJ